MENTEKSSAPVGGGGAKEKVEKQARQLAYDVRYKVRGALKAQSGGKSDPATVKKAYLSQLGKSPANPAVKTRAKQMLVGEDYINVNNVVAQGVASAMFKVFVEHHQKDADGNTIPHEEEIQEDDSKEKTYKVRVTDKESGNSYVRNATRAKIAELRNNPNISSVEMTEYGEVTKSEKYKGSKTASVKSGKGVDYDGDGKKESSSKEHAGVVHNAIQKKKGGTPDGKDTRKENYTWKEAFGGLIEKKSEEEEKKITGKGVNNAKLIKVFPDEVKEDVAVEVKKENEKDPNSKAKKEEDEDPRSIPTKMNLVKNKLRSMGLKMSQELEGETIEESEKTAEKAYERGQKLGAKRRQASYKKYGSNVGSPGKNERAAYNLASSARSRDASLETQSTKKKKPAGTDTSQIGHAKKRDEKTSVGKKGGKLKTPKYKLSFSQRVDHHSNKALNRRDPKQNPKHTANEEVVLEADSLSATVDRWEAARQKRMKQRQAYERPHWIPRDQDHEDRYGSSKGEKKVKKEEVETNSTVQSALDSLNTYYAKNEKLHGSLIHNEDAALDFVKKKIEREHGKGAYVSKDNPMKPQSAADKAKARAHQAKVDAENAAERAKDPSQGRYPKG